MADKTEAEYDALDERLTNTVPTLGHTGTGFFSRKGFQVVGLDETSAKIFNAKAIASHQTPSQVIASMLRNEFIHRFRMLGAFMDKPSRITARTPNKSFKHTFLVLYFRWHWATLLIGDKHRRARMLLTFQALRPLLNVPKERVLGVSGCPVLVTPP